MGGGLLALGLGVLAVAIAGNGGGGIEGQASVFPLDRAGFVVPDPKATYLSHSPIYFAAPGPLPAYGAFLGYCPGPLHVLFQIPGPLATVAFQPIRVHVNDRMAFDAAGTIHDAVAVADASGLALVTILGVNPSQDVGDAEISASSDPTGEFALLDGTIIKVVEGPATLEGPAPGEHAIFDTGLAFAARVQPAAFARALLWTIERTDPETGATTSFGVTGVGTNNDGVILITFPKPGHYTITAGCAVGDPGRAIQLDVDMAFDLRDEDVDPAKGEIDGNSGAVDSSGIDLDSVVVQLNVFEIPRARWSATPIPSPLGNVGYVIRLFPRESELFMGHNIFFIHAKDRAGNSLAPDGMVLEYDFPEGIVPPGPLAAAAAGK